MTQSRTCSEFAIHGGWKKLAEMALELAMALEELTFSIHELL